MFGNNGVFVEYMAKFGEFGEDDWFGERANDGNEV